MNYTELKVKKVGPRNWEVLEDWYTPYGMIPAGFVSNGANVHRFLWWFISPAGVLFEAAVFHDYYYQYALETKKYADSSFREIAKDYGAPTYQASLAYVAVKLLGRGKYE